MRTSPEDHTTGPVGIHNTPNIKYTLFLTLHLGHCACFRVLQKSKFAKWNAIRTKKKKKKKTSKQTKKTLKTKICGQGRNHKLEL